MEASATTQDPVHQSPVQSAPPAYTTSLLLSWVTPYFPPPTCPSPPPVVLFTSHNPSPTHSGRVSPACGGLTSPPGLPLTTDQVRDVFRRTKVRKATGPDRNSPRLLRDCADELCGVFQYIFNISLGLGRVPILWKTSCVVPVPKTLHSRELNHFRPVALTPHLMKALERIVLNHLRCLVGSELDPLQFAY